MEGETIIYFKRKVGKTNRRFERKYGKSERRKVGRIER